MSQMREYQVLNGHAKPPVRWSGTLLAPQYVKILEIKYSRLERGENEAASFCKILCEALDGMYDRERAAGKIRVMTKRK